MVTIDPKKVAEILVLLDDVDVFRSSYRDAVEDGLPTAARWRQRLVETEAKLKQAERAPPYETSQARIRRMLTNSYYR